MNKMTTITAIAPAKINLLLKVSPLKTGQVKHEVENVMHTISLHDTLKVRIEEASEFSCSINSTFENVADINCEEKDNLITIATKRFLEDNLLNDNLAITVDLTKRIPAQAGLGGGSADAAAMLLVLANHFKIATDLISTASRIGADVPFFIDGGHQKMSGAGEIPDEKLAPIQSSLVLVKPDVGDSTAEIYAEFEKFGKSSINNDLQEPAISLCPEIGEITEFLGADSQMTGSGSCVFLICKDFATASKITGEAKLKGWWARACSTIPTGARLLNR